MNALQLLSELDFQCKRDLYKSMPEYAIPRTRFSDKDTNSLTRAILATFKLHGIFASRIDSKGTFRQDLKRFIPTTQKRGLPDIFCQPSGLPSCWIEVKCKATNDRLKPHQVKIIEQLRNAGAIVFIAEDYQSFYEWFLTINKH